MFKISIYEVYGKFIKEILNIRAKYWFNSTNT